ncbi:nitroreductase family protein [Mycoplasma simbae]|uniref:nitroreductase family protein n=1 Tax=Mycoplasma simbae TaxID=36744 RepID=UPI0004983A3C|nr:nitroreductase family protein [Mycoplasma simbae]
MDFYTKIINRYSVREYDMTKPVSQEDYKKIIDVVESAPTSSNWHSSSVIVVKNREILEKLGATSKYTGSIKTCDMFLVFVADYNRMALAQQSAPELVYNNHSSEAYTVAVGDAFIQATMAQDMAAELGLGTCFLGLARTMQKELIELLNIKGQAFPVIGLTIGHIKEQGVVKPKLTRVFNDQYDINRLEQDIKDYELPLQQYFEKVAPGKKAWSYKEATIKSASSYRMDTELIEDIWGLKLQK